MKSITQLAIFVGGIISYLPIVFSRHIAMVFLSTLILWFVIIISESIFEGKTKTEQGGKGK